MATLEKIKLEITDGEVKTDIPYTVPVCLDIIDKYECEPCDDVVSIEAVIEWLKAKDIIKMSSQEEMARKELKALPSVRPQEPKWIPMKTRPMTEEEREHYREWSDVDEAMVFDCELPEDGQGVLVSNDGYVCVDTFCTDDGCYFEGIDIDDVDAWMPLPKPYKPQESEDNG